MLRVSRTLFVNKFIKFDLTEIVSLIVLLLLCLSSSLWSFCFNAFFWNLKTFGFFSGVMLRRTSDAVLSLYLARAFCIGQGQRQVHLESKTSQESQLFLKNFFIGKVNYVRMLLLWKFWYKLNTNSLMYMQMGDNIVLSFSMKDVF